jgi:hypothetical protein
MSMPSPLLFNFTVDYAIRMVQVNQDGLKLNGTGQLLFYADDVNISGEGVPNIKKNAEALVFASEETGLKVNADKPKYMVMSRDQNAGVSHNPKIDNHSLETAEEFRYLGTILAHQIPFRKKLRAD